MLKKLLTLFNGGWERCEPPSWWNADKEMKKWNGLPDSFKFKGKTFKYKALYRGFTDDMGSSASRFESSYNFYRKKR